MAKSRTRAKADKAESVGRKNLIINGAMKVWQRGTSFTNVSQYSADRWFTGNPGTMTVSRVDTPYGYGLSYARTGGAWGSYHRIEWQDVSWLKAGDKLTFQYISNNNSPGNSSLQDGAGGSGLTYFTNNISDEGNGYYKIVSTISVTQTLLDQCETAGYMQLSLEPYTSAGTVIFTNLQLELGSVATDFEHRSYGEELALCQRYYFVLTSDGGTTNYMVGAVESSVAAALSGVVFPTTMRTIPTGALLGTNVTKFFSSATGTDNSVSISANRSSRTQGSLLITGFSGGVAGQACSLYDGGTTSGISFDAEL